MPAGSLQGFNQADRKGAFLGVAHLERVIGRLNREPAIDDPGGCVTTKGIFLGLVPCSASATMGLSSEVR
jgi:hypothetical protein